MSEHIDSFLMSIGIALSRNQIKIEGATQELARPEILDQVDGSNVQQLIRLSLMTAQMDRGSTYIAEVGVLLSILKPELEIDFGLQVGVASAQTCALFAMHCIALQNGNMQASLAILPKMICSLESENDKKGLLEVLCWIGVLYEEVGDHQNAVGALEAALSVLNDLDGDDALLDNSALDMVRSDNQNVFAFPRLQVLHASRSSDIANALRDLIAAAKLRQQS